MNKLTLILRTARYFRGANLAAVAGMAVATAVLAGALMVGDSVRLSLRGLAEQRLGPVDHALAGSFFNQSLADRIQQSPQFAGRFDACEAAIILRGGAATEDRAGRAPDTQILAADHWVAVPRGRALVNQPLVDALDLKAGAGLYLSLPAVDETPRDAITAARGREDTTTALRLAGSQPAPAGMPSLFSLTGGQRPVRNVWVNLAELQAALDQPRRANVLLASARSPDDPVADVQTLNSILRSVITLDDYGLSLTRPRAAAEAILTARSTYLLKPVEDAAIATGISTRRVLSYLANTVAVAGPSDAGRKIHYAVVAGISDIDGQTLAADEVAINQWTADQLGVGVGDRLRLDYYQRQAGGELAEVRSDRPGVGLVFRVARILPTSGLGADNTLTPNYKGLTDAESVADWDPPEGLRIDQSLVSDADEDYWHQHRAAPKVLLNYDTARRLWGSTYGDLTSIRVPANQADAFQAALLRKLDPADLGMTFRPIKAQQIAASSGSTDFGGLFIGFSFFLIVAALVLLAMLLRLAVEQRARQIGLLSAVGFAPRAVRRLILGEQFTLAVAGAILGLGGAVAYTALMIHGLTTWWFDAIGTTAMQLHIVPGTLAMGGAIALVLALGVIVWATRRVSRVAPAPLLAGAWQGGDCGLRIADCELTGASGGEPRRHGDTETSTEGTDKQKSRIRRPGSPAHLAMVAVGGLGAVAAIAAGLMGGLPRDMAFLLGGFLILCAVLAWASARLRTADRRVQIASQASLALLAARRNPTRSTLTLALVSLASFILITVASMRQGPPADTHNRASGAGGFALILQSDIPLLGDLGTPAGRKLLGIDNPDDPIWARATFVPMRSWAGQDISCLNMTRPDRPTILGVPDRLIDRGGFARGQSPLATLRSAPRSEDRIPVLADAETAQYILKLGVGDAMPITDQLGRRRELVLVDTLHGSIFQSELLMAEGDFVRMFPGQSGWQTVLIDAPAADTDALRRMLPAQLADYSVAVERTADRLAAYQQVANTYLSTFQLLGALGLALGTLGLGVVLVRNLLERRAEMALLSAVGFRPADRVRLVLYENAALLAGGMLAGTLAALFATSPVLLGGQRDINLAALAATLGAILVLGLTVLAAATNLALRNMTPADLRRE